MYQRILKIIFCIDIFWITVYKLLPLTKELLGINFFNLWLLVSFLNNLFNYTTYFSLCKNKKIFYVFLYLDLTLVFSLYFDLVDTWLLSSKRLSFSKLCLYTIDLPNQITQFSLMRKSTNQNIHDFTQVFISNNTLYYVHYIHILL